MNKALCFIWVGAIFETVMGMIGEIPARDAYVFTFWDAVSTFGIVMPMIPAYLAGREDGSKGDE